MLFWQRLASAGNFCFPASSLSRLTQTPRVVEHCEMSIFPIRLLLFTTREAAVLQGEKVLYCIYLHFSLPDFKFNQGVGKEMDLLPSQTNSSDISSKMRLKSAVASKLGLRLSYTYQKYAFNLLLPLSCGGGSEAVFFV